MYRQRRVVSVWLAAAMALLVAFLIMAGSAVAQGDGVTNESEECVGDSCNSGAVQQIEIEPGCIITVVGLEQVDPSQIDQILADAGIIISDELCNQAVVVTPEQIEEEVEVCVGDGCNTGIVTQEEEIPGPCSGLDVICVGVEITVDQKSVGLNPNSGSAGSQVTILARGIGTEGFEHVTLRWYPVDRPEESQYLGEGVTDENRAFEYEFTVPDVAPGDYTVQADATDTSVDDFHRSVSAEFHVTETAAEDQYPDEADSQEDPEDLSSSDNASQDQYPLDDPDGGTSQENPENEAARSQGLLPASLPTTGASFLTLLGSGLSAAALALWRRRG